MGSSICCCHCIDIVAFFSKSINFYRLRDSMTGGGLSPNSIIATLFLGYNLYMKTLLLLSLFLSLSFAEATLAPDGTYVVGGQGYQRAPDGTYLSK